MFHHMYHEPQNLPQVWRIGVEVAKALEFGPQRLDMIPEIS